MYSMKPLVFLLVIVSSATLGLMTGCATGKSGTASRTVAPDISTIRDTSTIRESNSSNSGNTSSSPMTRSPYSNHSRPSTSTATISSSRPTTPTPSASISEASPRTTKSSPSINNSTSKQPNPSAGATQNCGSVPCPRPTTPLRSSGSVSASTTSSVSSPVATTSSAASSGSSGSIASSGSTTNAAPGRLILAPAGLPNCDPGPCPRTSASTAGGPVTPTPSPTPTQTPKPAPMCHWSSATNFTTSEVKRGSRCTNGSLDVQVTNHATWPVKLVFFFRKPDGSWSRTTDGAFERGVAPNQRKDVYQCQASEVVVVGMPLKDYLEGKCKFPDAPPR